tara:strand:+ start:1079 stop:1375 length:297 start_codon:yes stop_codon:yes gene_type:complete
MAMPKGFKSENGYGTSKQFDGMTYHQIADQLNEQGFKMNHSTARNVYVKALMKIASEVTDLYEVTMDQKKLKKIAINPEFQETIRDFMDELDSGVTQW